MGAVPGRGPGCSSSPHTLRQLLESGFLHAGALLWLWRRWWGGGWAVVVVAWVVVVEAVLLLRRYCSLGAAAAEGAKAASLGGAPESLRLE